MCYFITATMSPNGNESEVRRLAKASLLKWEALENPGIIKQLLDGEGYFLTTRGMCNCETEIGLRNRLSGSLAQCVPDLTRDIKKKKKQGWSSDKIDRWAEETKAHAARRHDEASARLSGPHLEIGRWIQFVSSVLRGHHADWIGILVHWYSGKVASEAITAQDRRWLNFGEFTEDCWRSRVIWLLPNDTKRGNSRDGNG